jgi:hypothetical protein
MWPECLAVAEAAHARWNNLAQNEAILPRRNDGALLRLFQHASNQGRDGEALHKN